METITRLSLVQEEDLMLPSSNDDNLEQFGDLLPEFGYTSKSNKRIMARLEERTSLDHWLGLNEQLRAWYSVPNTEDDGLYIKYNRAICQLDEKWEFLGEEEIYLAGKVVVDGQTRKLFKLLLELGVNARLVEELTTLRATKKQTYLCVSRNPVDFLMASTNQSFSSCINLESDFEGAYYLGLPSMVLDTNRYMVFLTTGKIKKHTVKGRVFKHFGYSQRSWILLGRDKTGKLSAELPRIFPEEENKFLPAACRSAVGVGIVDQIIGESWKPARFAFDPDEVAAIYFDSGYVDDYPFGISYDRNDDVRKGTPMGINWTRGFSAWSGEPANGEKCEDCGAYFSRDTMTDVCNARLLVCQSCLDDDYFYCDSCDTWERVGSATRVGDNYYCEYCLDRYFFQCEECGDYFRDGRGIDVTNEHGNILCCPSCADNIAIECNECGDLYHVDLMTEIDDDYYCPDCIKANFTECVQCNKLKLDDTMSDVKTDDGVIKLCEDCAAENATTEGEI